MRPSAARLSLAVLTAAWAATADGRLGAQPADLSLEIESVHVASETFRVRVYVNGLEPGVPWYPQAVASFRWEPQHLEFVDFHWESFHLLCCGSWLSPDGSGLTFEFVCGFFCLPIESPVCRQAIAEITFRALSVFEAATIDLLDYLLTSPLDEPSVHDQNSEPVISPTLFDGVVRLRPFRRGDLDASGTLTVTDAIAVLHYLFLAAVLECSDPADADDDGGVNITDAIYLLRHLFAGGPPPPAPFVDAGLDPTQDELACEPLPGPGICGG